MTSFLRYAHVVTRRLVVEHPPDWTGEEVLAVLPLVTRSWRTARSHTDEAFLVECASASSDEAAGWEPGAQADGDGADLGAGGTPPDTTTSTTPPPPSGAASMVTSILTYCRDTTFEREVEHPDDWTRVHLAVAYPPDPLIFRHRARPVVSLDGCIDIQPALDQQPQVRVGPDGVEWLVEPPADDEAWGDDEARGGA